MSCTVREKKKYKTNTSAKSWTILKTKYVNDFKFK